MPLSEGSASAPAQDTRGTPCESCGTVVAPALLVCPKCQALVHRAELERLASAAGRASDSGEIAEALVHWRKALSLLPAESKQAKRVTGAIRGLRQKLDDGVPATRSPEAAAALSNDSPTRTTPKTRWQRWRGATTSVLALLVLKLKSLWLLLLTGWKPLLVGLTKLGTLSSMLLSLGVYWGLYGWRFALGLVLCIYVHEIGHVVALKRLGIAASSPMFIPGLGAVVRLQQYPIDVDEEAQVGLAGPRWGLGVTVVVFIAGRLLHSPMLGVIANFSAWINLFNLIPIPPLDGGRGFRALDNPQRLLAAALLGGVYALTQRGFVGILALIALARGFEKRPEATRNTRILIEYVAIALLLALLMRGS